MSAKNVARLEKAGLVDTKRVSATHMKRLTKLSSAEVSTLIRVKKKLKFSGRLHRKTGKVDPDTVF
jgi:hypothetical protein